MITSTGNIRSPWGPNPPAFKQRWKEESDRNILNLYAKAEKRQQAEQAQKEYAEGVEPIEAFPTP